jgi:hypothetical protein
MEYVPGQLQVRLALVQIQIGTANQNPNREVHSLIQDANRLHFRLLARKAQAVQRRTPFDDPTH